MFGPPAEHHELLARVARVTGPAQELTAYDSRRTWWFAVRHRGRDLRVGLSTDDGWLTGLYYAAPLGARPLHCDIEGTFASSMTLPLLRTGDPQFDAETHVHGAPAEVVLHALDAPTRRWILETHRRPKFPQISTVHGHVRIYRSYRRKSGMWALCGVDLPEPGEIAQWLDAVQALADRLTGSFDAAVAAMQAQHGAVAVQQWLRQVQAADAARVRTRAKVRALVIGGVLLIFVVPLLVVVAIVILALARAG